jgi:N-acetylneuraminic acid mutarotase
MFSKVFIFLIFLCPLKWLGEGNNLSAQGTWTQKANFAGTNRVMAIGFSIGNKGYISLGASCGICLNDLWEWDQVTNTWTQKAAFPGTAITGAVAFSIGTKGYVGTGNTGSTYTNEFWEWDQTNNVWTQKANFGGTGRWHAIGFSIGTKGYIGTGDDNSVSSWAHDFWEWDQATDSWTQRANYPGGAKADAVGFSVLNRGYIVTGDTFSAPNSTFSTQELLEYNPGTNLWTTKASFVGIARQSATGFSIGNKGYVGTGETGLTDFWEWDQNLDVWTQKANYGGAGVYWAVGFSIGNRGYIGTGLIPSLGSTDEFWEYNPDGIDNISEVYNEPAVSVYPNPITASATFIFTDAQKNAVLKIYDLLGKEIREFEIPNGAKSFIFEKENISSGVYFYKISSQEKNRFSGKLVIE